MAELSDKYTKILSDIRSNISIKDERKYVEKKLIELSAIYLELLDRLTKVNNVKISKIEENQEEIIEKIAKIQESMNIIKNDIYDFEGYEFEIVCPYCNFEFVTEVENKQKKEIPCPHCNNVIELDWDDNEENSKDRHTTGNKNIKNQDEDDEF